MPQALIPKGESALGHTCCWARLGVKRKVGGQTCKGLWVPEKQLLNVGHEEPVLHSGRVAETDFLQLTKYSCFV